MQSYRMQFPQWVTDFTRYGQTDPYIITNYSTFPGARGNQVPWAPYNAADQPIFPYDQLDAIRLIMRRHISNAKRIYPYLRVVIKNGESVPISGDYLPLRMNVETEDDMVIKVFGMY